MTKRALLIGINYYKSPGSQLNGCINDVNEIKLLLLQFGYKTGNIVTMTDKFSGIWEPTKKNILAQIDLLVKKTVPGDTVFVHYSGHGTQIYDMSGDEKKNETTPGRDDCICPSDFLKAGIITDDILKDRLVNKIPVGAKLRVFLDCCFSGSGLDLEFTWKHEDIYINEGTTEKLSDDIIMISGCKDDQLSYDAWNITKQQANGALTMALCLAIANSTKIKTTWKELLLVVRHYMTTNGFDQFPMLSVSHIKLGDLHIDL